MRLYIIFLFLLSILTLSSSKIIPLIALHQQINSPLGKPHELSKRESEASRNPCDATPNVYSELCHFLDGRDYGFEDIELNNNENSRGYLGNKWHNYPRKLKLPFVTGPYQRADASKVKEFLLGIDSRVARLSNPLFHVVDIDPTDEVNNIEKLKENEDVPGGKLRMLDDPELIRQDSLNYNNNDDGNLRAAIEMLEIRENGANKSNYTDILRNLRRNELKTVVKKRYVSLWSRLQAMSPQRGHDVSHRRHIHLFYHHLPEEIEGRPIPEDPRALFKRPPGSPLRWG